jgi:predicted PurR-regulated permease PerM
MRSPQQSDPSRLPLPGPDPVPGWLRTLSAIAWRLLVVAAAVVVVALVLSRLRLVVLPVFAALLLATVLEPPARFLRGRGWPPALAAATVLVAGIAVLGGAVFAVVRPVIDEFDKVDVSVQGGVRKVGDWLIDGPLGLSRSQVDTVIDRAFAAVRAHSDLIAGGVLSGTVVALEVLAGALLTIVLLFFFLKEGERIWEWVLGLVPRRLRADARAIGERSWTTLGGYLRGVATVGLVDAVFIGLALYLIGVPFVLALALLTFLGGFIPIVGASLAGFAAVMVALVSEGLVDALLVLAAVLAVQQLEGNLLQPVIVGRSVRLHPVAILLSVAAGGVLWGVLGAFVSVPIVAVLTSAAGHLRDPRRGVSGATPPGRSGGPAA